MRVLTLLFDPRGAVDRRAFWSGLLQLTALSVVVALGLSRLDPGVGLAALPVIGDVFVTGGVAGYFHGACAPDVALAASLGLVAARSYVAACLILKRARDAGRDPDTVIAFGLANLAVHGLTGLWAYNLFGEGMAVIVPLMADLAITTLLGLGFVTWLAALRAAPPTASRRAQVKPPS